MTNHSTRQPVHTVYGGAHLFAPDTVSKLGAIAVRALRDYAPDPGALAAALDFDCNLAARIYPRVVAKLTNEPVEDYRLDFEDGFGHRPDDEEDAVARRAAANVAAGLAAATLPARIGIRIKSLSEDALARRGLRTFDVFLNTLLDATAGRLPNGFVITLPKITGPDQVARLASACAEFETAHRMPEGQLQFEIMIETPSAIFAPDGRAALPSLVAHGNGRIVGAHFGAYDYTASLGITAAHQYMRHSACDFARHVMQVTLADTNVWLSDGATNIMPVPPHRGPTVTAAERAANVAAVHSAWREHVRQVRHALAQGFYQGWDLHPAQLPTRFAAVYAFFLEGLDTTSERLKNFVRRAAQATVVGGVFDDAATGQGLLNYFLRAMNCGAMTEAEAVEMSGLTVEEIRSRSFATIVNGRR
jgi:citrate lyase beta subunit